MIKNPAYSPKVCGIAFLLIGVNTDEASSKIVFPWTGPDGSANSSWPSSVVGSNERSSDRFPAAADNGDCIVHQWNVVKDGGCVHVHSTLLPYVHYL